MDILYASVPLLCGPESTTEPSLLGTLTVINGVTCIQKPNGQIASLDPNGQWRETDPANIKSPAANWWEHCPPDPNLNVLVFKYAPQGIPLVYKIAYSGRGF